MSASRDVLLRADHTDSDGWHATVIVWGTADSTNTSVTVRDGHGIVCLRAMLPGGTSPSEYDAARAIVACRNASLPTLRHVLGLDARDWSDDGWHA